jgi:hypothetical protein
MKVFSVRKQVSGWTGDEKFIVVVKKTGSRVTVHAHLVREHAQAHADQLNIGEMVKPYAEDPRPYDVRLEEARCTYFGGGK